MCKENDDTVTWQSPVCKARVLLAAAYGSHTVAFVMAFCAVYTIGAILVMARIGFLSKLEEVAFSSFDSKNYRALADFFTGHASRPSSSLIGIRPFLFPIFLSIYHLVGVTGFVILQWCLNLVTLTITFLTVRNLTKSALFGLAAAVVLALHPTFNFIALHALTESLALALVTVAVHFIALFCSNAKRHALFLSCFFLCAASCTKAVYLPFFFLWCLYAGYTLIRSHFFSARVVCAAAIAISPLIVQLVLSFVLTGHPTVSTAGRYNIEMRFFPAVHGFANGNGIVFYNSVEAEEARQKYPAFGDKVRFIATHPWATGRVIIQLLGANLMSSSSFTQHPRNLIVDKPLSRLLTRSSILLNVALVPVHVAGFLVLIGFLLARPKELLGRATFYLACLAYSVMLCSVLTYWQGDRLILAAVPAWIVLYPSAAQELMQIHSIQRLTRAFKR